eukprot:GFYU01004787.1.p1 GENE.GFYU01004787.1~~GFYU01004787.1.p1  ORF type:complete len:556 (-),score=72.85 GFYU01004787.1:243-1910(-)
MVSLEHVTLVAIAYLVVITLLTGQLIHLHIADELFGLIIVGVTIGFFKLYFTVRNRTLPGDGAHAADSAAQLQTPGVIANSRQEEDESESSTDSESDDEKLKKTKFTMSKNLDGTKGIKRRISGVGAEDGDDRDVKSKLRTRTEGNRRRRHSARRKDKEADNGDSDRSRNIVESKALNTFSQYRPMPKTQYEFRETHPYPIIEKDVVVITKDEEEFVRTVDQSKPAVLSQSGITETANTKWTVEYLAKHLPDNFNVAVKESPNRSFLYCDQDKNIGGFDTNFDVKMTHIPFSAFAKKLQEANEKLENGQETKRYYLQQMLTDGVGSTVTTDYTSFAWSRIGRISRLATWGPLKLNLLLVGMRGNLTPAHYDEQHNLFSQVRGTKRVLLFPPTTRNFRALSPFPLFHPCDRQTQIDYDNPDFERFPYLKEAHGMEVIVKPGDVLYIPPYWWHQVESMDETISVTFWFVQKPPVPTKRPDGSYNIEDSTHYALRRNIERILSESIGAKKVGELLNDKDIDMIHARELAKQVAGHILPKTETDQFIKDLVGYRYMYCT